MFFGGAGKYWYNTFETFAGNPRCWSVSMVPFHDWSICFFVCVCQWWMRTTLTVIKGFLFNDLGSSLVHLMVLRSCIKGVLQQVGRPQTDNTFRKILAGPSNADFGRDMILGFILIFLMKVFMFGGTDPNAPIITGTLVPKRPTFWQPHTGGWCILLLLLLLQLVVVKRPLILNQKCFWFFYRQFLSFGASSKRPKLYSLSTWIKWH